MKTCEVLNLTKSSGYCLLSTPSSSGISVWSKSFKWKRDWGEHSLHSFKKWYQLGI